MIPQNIGSIIIETAATDADDQIRAKVVGEYHGRLIVEAILQDLNKKNRNGRFYDETELLPQLTCKRTTELLKSGNFKGENGHPLSKELTRQATIDPNNVVCKYLKLWREKDYIKAWVVSTPDAKGPGYEACIKDGELPSYSMRALGSIHQTGRGAEVRNIRLITWDRVYYPSHEVAYTCENGIMIPEDTATERRKQVQESVNEGSKLILDDNDKGMIVPIDNKKAIEYIREQSKNMKTLQESMNLIFENAKVVKSKYGSKVQLQNSDGNIILLNLESYVAQDIMDGCIDGIIG